MKERQTRSLVTGCLLVIVLVLIAAGVAPAGSGREHAAQPVFDHYVPDAQFAQYLQYRVHLENASNCQ